MSVFYGTIKGQAKTTASRRGSKESGISAHVRGWDVGVKVRGDAFADGSIWFTLTRTGGSNAPGEQEVLAVVKFKNGEVKVTKGD